MTTNDVTYNSNIENMIIANLDGWVVDPPTPENTETEITNVTRETQTSENTETETGTNPFMTSEELQTKANKVITSTECQLFYEEALDMAYMHTNRLNIDDLSEMEARTFIRAVCKWTASNLWNKYNIRVNNEDLEDTYVQSYGGLLYKSAIKSLQPFINQRISNLTKFTKNTDNDDIWIV